MMQLIKSNLIDLVNEINNNFNQSLDLNHIEQNPVSELQMHKILYLLFGEFYLEFNKNLFNQPNFEAWKYGPVEIDYRQSLINHFQAPEKFNITINESERLFLEKLIQKLLKLSPWDLVDISHSSPAWINNYQADQQWSQNKISLTDLQNYY